LRIKAVTMRPVTVPIFALLLVVLSLPAVSAGPLPAVQESPSTQFDDPSPVMAPVEDFANYARIPDDNVSSTAYGTVSVDVAGAVASDASSLRGEYRTTAFEDSFYGTESPSERTEIISAEVRRTERETDELRRERADTIQAYAAGSMSTAAFVRQMALIDARAQRVAATISRVKDVSRASSYSVPRDLDTRIENVRGELEVLRGPVAQRAGAAVAGDRPIESVYVESSDSGYTLAMVDGDSYYRETYLAEERRPEATDQFRESDLYLVNAANRRGIELYPWVTNDTSPSGQALGESGIYRFRAEYTSGDLTAYLDGGSTNVFREHQRQSVTAIPVTDTITERNDSLEVRINRTYETGPMSVRIVDNETREPVAGTIHVDETRVGSTGEDGTLWLVEPRPGVPMTIETEDGTVVEARLPP
jgi:hypothetical protein